MKRQRDKKRSAFAYCVHVIVILAVISFLMLLGTFGVMAIYGVSFATMQATIGILLIFLFNLALVCPMLISRKLVKPLSKLNQASAKLAKGQFDVDLDYNGNIQELDSLFDDMRTMAGELSSVETLRSDFVSTVSHEFKTPLASIEGYATLLQNPDLTEADRQDCTDKILSGTRRLSTLVSNVLMLSRLERRKVTPEYVDYRLDDQIMQVLLEQEPAWSQKNIDFDLNLNAVPYHGAEALLYHVWSNLIGNAVKYSPEGGQVAISLAKENSTIIFWIEDHGPGIGEKDLKHIFEKFYQADTAHKKEGNGLGLAQVKQILDLLGGSVSAESDGTSGTTFTVILPVEAQKQSE